MIINEELLYYVWQYKVFDHNNLTTITGDNVKILNYGIRNLSSGPDFSNVKIEINDIIWAGNMEIHVLSSDWKKHNHDADEAYKNVVLHVVYDNDKNHLPDNIPVIVLKDRIDKSLIEKFSGLMDATTWIPCENSIKKVDLSRFSLWSNKLTIERLAYKTHDIVSTESYKNGDWHQLLHERIARYFGTKDNSDIFQVLASLIPYNLIRKISFDPWSIESVVFGCSGFLDEEAKDDYHQRLINEYNFQKTKLKLSSLRKVEWKNFGMFPSGQPTFRLAQFAAYLCQAENMFDQILSAQNISDITKLFNGELSEYWNNHFRFGKETTAIKSNKLSASMIERITINAIVPVLFSYAQLREDDDLIDKCLSILDSITAEENTIIKKWKSLGLKPKTASEGQALLQLKHKYCDGKQCLKCNIGIEIIKNPKGF